MPKEYIYSNSFTPESKEHPAPPIVSKVTWSREDAGGGVQMAIFRKDGTFESEHEDPMYMDLQRRDINQLIRVLRRARDQAYGNDE